jgi:hypothetical protein
MPISAVCGWWELEEKGELSEAAVRTTDQVQRVSDVTRISRISFLVYLTTFSELYEFYRVECYQDYKCELRIVWKEVIVAYFMALSQY